MNPADAYDLLLRCSVLLITVLIFACLVRAILGPRFTDRIVAINIISTKVIIIIAILAYLFRNDTLLDSAIVYAMISFLAVVVLSKCYLLPHHVNPADPEHDFHNREEEEAEPYDR